MDRSYWDADTSYNPETVRFFDVAHEGAQVRALIPVVDRFSQKLRDYQFRSALVIPTDEVAYACAQYVAQQQSSLPIMVAQPDVLPNFIGALDLVIVVGERAVADLVSQQLISASNRGAVTVFIGPGQGPLRDDAPAETLICPALPTAMGSSPSRYIAGLQMVFSCLGQSPEATEGYLAGIASQLDEELSHLSPERGVEVNPGRQLREFADGVHVIHTGGPLARVAAAIWAAGGLGGTFVEPDLVLQVLERRNAQLPTDDGQDLFHDPLLDGPALVVSKVICWGGEDEPGSGISPLVSAPHVLTVSTGNAPVMGSRDAAGTGFDPAADAHPLQLVVRAFAATVYDSSSS